MFNTNYIKIMKKTILVGVAALMLATTSCEVNRHFVGGMSQYQAKEKFSSAKQLYLFWGGVSVGNASPSLPSRPDFMIKSSKNVFDMILKDITLGILSTRTIKVYVPREKPTMAIVPVKPAIADTTKR